ncbi:hypothetical protein TW85_11745 [Marinomonas sp. S3726]|uniref:condensation domain-containing protein n=1 Tax=Marinomonas sp. S3726 TaxID=579484 RepID=UPI0005FA3CBC|nr:condensation domain-containing protein [Marinomonas sp. S3726]KJZ13862.1 hypothetical protein TW85_11745 [Marinomonas sp. S3726]
MELETTIAEQVKHTLNLVDQTIPPDASLIEFGLHSLAIMQLVDAFQQEYDRELNYVDFASMPTIQDWVSLLRVPVETNKKDENLAIKQEASHDNLVLAPAEGLKESHLSEMQYSFWAGQQATDVSAHLYVEFDGDNIDQIKLVESIRNLLKIHPMLRAAISNTGSQTIAEFDPDYQINIDDIREWEPIEVDRFLEAKRYDLAHQELAIQLGQVIHFDLTLLPNKKHRLHIDVNMAAADAPSILLTYQSLAALYSGKYEHLSMSNLSYFDYLERVEQDEKLKAAAEKDRLWWQARLADIPPPPKLPLIAEKFRQDTYKCDSLHHVFTAHDKSVLSNLAQKHQVSLSTLMLTVFSNVVGNWSSSNRFRLNLPMFGRQQYDENINQLVGDFTNLIIFSAELIDEEPLGQMLRRFEEEREQVLAHNAYSGMNVMRDLSKLNEETEVAPIVYTCGFGQGEVVSDLVKTSLGNPVWCVSQGPMVDLDVQVAEHNNGILVNWDVRTAAFKEGVVDSMFEAYLALIHALVFSNENTESRLKPKLPLKQRQARHGLALPSYEINFSESFLATGFRQQVFINPNQTALVIDNEKLTYQMLSSKVNQALNSLKAKGVVQGDTLALKPVDVAFYVASVLASLELGANFILYHHDAADSEKAKILSSANYLLCDEHDELSHEAEIIIYEDMFDNSVSHDLICENDLTESSLNIAKSHAYSVYDTEVKSLVGVSYQSLSEKLEEVIDIFSFDQSSCLLSLHEYTNKSALMDILVSLSSGGSLILMSELQQSDTNQWLKLIKNHAINCIHCPSLRLSEMLLNASNKALSPISLVLSTGQTLSSHWEKLKRHNKTMNLVALHGNEKYLPYMSYQVCDDLIVSKNDYLPIGKAFANASFKVINEQGVECPDYVLGQLWATHKGISFERAHLEGEWLATHQHMTAFDWHNTGEFAYYQTDGSLVSSGIAEDLITIQGYKIEPSELTSLVLTLEGVLDAKFVSQTDQNQVFKMVAIIAEEGVVDSKKVHAKLAEVLPKHALPDYYYIAESLPLTQDGALDSHTVLNLCLKQSQTQTSIENESPLEEAVSYIFSKTIGVDVSITRLDDDFFESGGDSLLATHLTATLNQYFKGSELTIVDIFVERTPENIAAKIKDNIPELADKIAQVLLKVLRKKQ